MSEEFVDGAPAPIPAPRDPVSVWSRRGAPAKLNKTEDDPVATTFQEFTMKRILVALVLALGVATVVGCGGSSPTTGGSTGGTGKK